MTTALLNMFSSWLFHVLVICMCLAFSLGTLPGYIQRGDIICKVTSCEPGMFVDGCTKNGTSDVCVICPPGTEMKDTTSSRLVNIQCTQKEACPADTRPSLNPSNCRFIPRKLMFCICDTARLFCGLDPCGCQDYRNRPCPYGFVLQQDCGCGDPVASTTIVRPTDSFEERSFRPNTSTNIQTSEKTDEETEHPRSTDPTTKHIMSTTAAQITTDTISEHSVLLKIILPVSVCFVILCVVFGITYTRKKGSISHRNRNQSGHEENQKSFVTHGYNIMANGNVKIFQAENFQEGDNNNIVKCSDIEACSEDDDQ